MDVPADVLVQIYQFMYLSLSPAEFEALKKELPGWKDYDPDKMKATTNLAHIQAMLKVGLTPEDLDEFKERIRWI